MADPQSSATPILDQGQNAMLSAQNPVTQLTDSQAAALQSVLDAKDKEDAKQAVTLHGSQTMRQLLDAHNAASTMSNKSGSPTSTPSTNTASTTNASPSNSTSILDPLIKAAQTGQTTLPAQQINNPAGPANVQRGNFEQDKTSGLFEKVFGMPQAYQDAQGITHYKPGGFMQAGRNQEYLDQAKSLQGLSGTEQVQPKDSIAYGLEAAKQTATNVPMTQPQQAEYNLSLQDKALTLAGQQRDQFNAQTTPIITSLQKLDQLLPLEQAAVGGDKTAGASLVAGAKELYGQAGNILGQGMVQKLVTYAGGAYDKNSIKGLVANMKTVRAAMIKKLTAATKNASSKIGDLKLGDKTIAGRDLLNNPYASETLSKGDTEGGFRFNGGDPSDKKNWSKS